MTRRSLYALLSGLLVAVVGCPPGPPGGGNANRNVNAANTNRNVNAPGNANAPANQNMNAEPVGMRFAATLTGTAESPPVFTNGMGTGTFALDVDQTELTFDITASGLSGPVTAAHFHLGALGVAGDVVFGITNTIMESNGQVTAAGVWPLSDADRTALLAGDIYVNLHTGANPAGEIRGQLTPAP